MQTYHKIIEGGNEYYLPYNPSFGGYELDERLSKEEVIDELLEEAVVKEVIYDYKEINRVISTIPNKDDRIWIQNFIEYLESVIEWYI